MIYVVESAARRLRRELGLAEKTVTARHVRVDDYFPFRIGDHVREHEGRHVGIVKAILSNTVRVRWEDTGHVTDFDDHRTLTKVLP